MFDEYLARWDLTPDGDPIVTWGARLLPVRRQGEAAMLKIAINSEEKFGGLLMTWWNGEGAARVLAASDEAILLERALGQRSLSDYARNGRDDEATAILCDVVAKLHAPRPQQPPELIPLKAWFKDLAPAASAHGGVLARCLAEADRLLADPREITVLHGDIHHDNVLDFGERGWFAIDPKRLIGERGFDYANIFSNPDLSDPSRPVATLPGCFQRRLEIVTARSGLERRRLLQWIIAWSGLSAAWFLEDGNDPDIDFHVAEQAIAEFDR
ncbi:aminoglycoside phosphotransferase family protein [Bradyrhizobium prioriisuperbiae]|uniref:aminoglycoside phosphotransferase family protein n=1 Tax=Bradyrhizobium prioriisuperbiae TaxID=2854389 RepID=UPI0028EF57A1|nr:aminoglycoside phosphotransferase family protein [Bradyrhizobium prioritasuperba]